MENKKYEIRVRYIFEGKYLIQDKDVENAKRNVVENCGLVMDGSIHTALNGEDIDWEFPIHPDMKIVSVKLKRQKNEKARINA